MVKKIVEDLKRDVWKYLNKAVAKKEWKVDDFSLVSIAENVSDRKDRVEKVLDVLKEDEQVNKRYVGMNIYLPETKNGEKIAKELERGELITLSPYVALFFALLILFIASPYIIKEAPADVTDFYSAYLKGVKDGIFYAAIGGMLMAKGFQELMRRFYLWRISSEETYYDIVLAFRYSVYIIVASLMVYYAYTQQTGTQMVGGILATIIFGSVPIAFSYVKLRKGK